MKRGIAATATHCLLLQTQEGSDSDFWFVVLDFLVEQKRLGFDLSAYPAAKNKLAEDEMFRAAFYAQYRQTCVSHIRPFLRYSNLS
ncbi:MAG: hypothetical protein AAF902_02365 [Chloroflexota bacterium]